MASTVGRLDGSRERHSPGEERGREKEKGAGREGGGGRGNERDRKRGRERDWVNEWPMNLNFFQHFHLRMMVWNTV